MFWKAEHNNNVTGTSSYDGKGHRIQKTEWNQISQQYETIIYIYARGKVCYEKNITTGLDALHIYGPTGRIAKKAGDDIVYYHTDHLGSTRLLTDASGNPVTTVGYYPFGITEYFAGEKEKYLFTGQEMDATGLYYLKARFYDPDTGRFLTEDTWGGDYKDPQTLNKYIYCLNNPLKYTDPSGNRPPQRGDMDIDPDELPTLVTDPEEGEKSDDDVDWENLGKCLGYYTGQQIAQNLVDFNLDTNYQNSREGIQQKSLALYAEAYGLEGEDYENFKKGFLEGITIGIASEKLKYDKMFANLESEVQELANDVSEAVVKAFAAELVLGIASPELLPELWALIETAEALDTLASAIDTLNEEEPKKAGLGIYLVVLGLLTSILVQRRKKRHSRLKKEQSRREKTEVKT